MVFASQTPETDSSADSQRRENRPRRHRPTDYGGGGWGAAPADRAPGRRRATVAERLEAGQIDAERARELTHEAVLRTLTASAKSRRDLERSLARRGYPEEIAAGVLDRLTEVGLIDDVAYAASLVRVRHAERGLSRRALAAELARKGLGPDCVADALEQVTDEDEHQAAADLAAKLLRRSAGQPREARLRKAVAALGRRGYGPSVAFEVARRSLAAEEGVGY